MMPEMMLVRMLETMLEIELRMLVRRPTTWERHRLSSSLWIDTVAVPSQDDCRLTLMAMADAFASSLVHQVNVFRLFVNKRSSLIRSTGVSIGDNLALC